MLSPSSVIRKFSSFLAKNYDAPFVVKKVIWQNTLSSATLYSCETWMVKDITAVQTEYMSYVKDLLGVRTQTPSNIIYVELDNPSGNALVRRRQISFLKKQRTVPILKAVLYKRIFKWQRTPSPLWDSILET